MTTILRIMTRDPVAFRAIWINKGVIGWHEYIKECRYAIDNHHLPEEVNYLCLCEEILQTLTLARDIRDFIVKISVLS